MDTYFEKVTAKDKVEKYQLVIKQIMSVVEGEEDLIANLANISAILKMNFDKYSWVGFYLWKKDELVLGPFQGKPACVRIKKGRGVCGTAFNERKTLMVPDVSKYPDHIYCDHDTKSEIVVPLLLDGKIIGVLDIDSNETDTFDDSDRIYLENLIQSISTRLMI
jgi:L-methionine (R)-S-oxide reductase